MNLLPFRHTPCARLLLAVAAAFATASAPASGTLPDAHAAATVDATPPAPAVPPGIEVRDIAIGNPARALPGTLTIPAGATRAPAVVLVHGSGPQDRDQSIGPNAPFRDIAHGLAARGVATLRYDKRTRARPFDFPQGVTIDNEVVDDAVAAILLLRAEPGIDPGRVFVLGHSLGGMLAPRIAQASDASGAILFAAPARPVLDLLVEQTERAIATRAGPDDAGRGTVDRLRRSIARLRAGEALADTESPLGQPASYWRDLESVAPVAEALALRKPLLLLHGGRDIQVTDTDWALWSDAFAGHDGDATLRAYPALSHLGIAGTGPGSLQDYTAPGHVDAALIDDIAAWLHAR